MGNAISNSNKRAAAKIVNMTPGGFNPMMENETMSVKTLELLAGHFKKPVSYFFEEEIESLNESDPCYTCRNCAEKDGMIKLLEKQALEKVYNKNKSKYLAIVKGLCYNKDDLIF